MVLLPKVYREQLGLPVSMPPEKVSKFLEDMISKSIGNSMVSVVVEVLGTEETQDLSVQVSTRVPEETN